MDNLKIIEAVAKIQRLTLKDDVLIIQVPVHCFTKEVGKQIGDIFSEVGIDMKQVVILPDEFKLTVLRKIGKGKKK